MRGKLYVISGPSGAGLKDIVSRVIESRDDIGAVVPVTARKMKDGEQNGIGFYFYDLDGWNALRESGDLLEETEFAGNDYGTSRHLVLEQFEAGKNVVLNLETERAVQIKKNMPEAVCVYVEPSGEEILRARYEKTARSSFEVSARMKLAEKQRALSAFCDVRICSDDPEKAVRELNGLIDRNGEA